ncbi:MAG: alpha/beta fold hydrolase [Saprospiraceae bacterium]|nr:alpha/beta fold hydrolase [Saprospiraceae bacterium]
MTEHELKVSGEYTYLDIGPRSEFPLVLLHGLFGTASNFDALINHFSGNRRIVMPILPIFEMSIRKVSLSGLLEYIEAFILHMSFKKVHLLGNSLGGHLAIIYSLDNQSMIKSLTLTGSSGLYESAFGTSFPKREDYEFIRKKVQLTFYDPNMATKEMVDEVFGIVNDRMKGIRVIKTAKSAIRHNVENRLHELNVPCLLVWGKQDTITPAFVGEKFRDLLSNSKLEILEECGHAPMLEKASSFNRILEEFLHDVEKEETGEE